VCVKCVCDVVVSMVVVASLMLGFVMCVFGVLRNGAKKLGKQRTKREEH